MTEIPPQENDIAIIPGMKEATVHPAQERRIKRWFHKGKEKLSRSHTPLIDKAKNILEQRKEKHVNQERAGEIIAEIGMQGDLHSQQQDFQQRLSANPDDVDAKAGLARVTYWQGDTTTAKSLTQEALAATPDNALAHTIAGVMMVGEAVDAMNDPIEQRRLLEEAQQHFSAAPEQVVSALFTKTSSARIQQTIAQLSTQIEKGVAPKDAMQQLALLRLALKFRQIRADNVDSQADQGEKAKQSATGDTAARVALDAHASIGGIPSPAGKGEGTEIGEPPSVDATLGTPPAGSEEHIKEMEDRGEIPRGVLHPWRELGRQPVATEPSAAVPFSSQAQEVLDAGYSREVAAAIDRARRTLRRDLDPDELETIINADSPTTPHEPSSETEARTHVEELALMTREQGMGYLHGKFPSRLDEWNSQEQVAYAQDIAGFYKGVAKGSYNGTINQLESILGSNRFDSQKQPTNSQSLIIAPLGLSLSASILRPTSRKRIDPEQADWTEYSYSMPVICNRDSRPGTFVVMHIAVPPPIADKIDRTLEKDATFMDKYFQALYPGYIGPDPTQSITRRPATELLIKDFRHPPDGNILHQSADSVEPIIRHYPSEIPF